MTLEEAKDILSRLFFDDYEWAVHTEPGYCNSGDGIARSVIEAIDTVLKALEEKQKEIEEKDNELHILHYILDNDYISKEKIRDRLRLFQDNSLSYMNLVLFQSIMELLGEE